MIGSDHNAAVAAIGGAGGTVAFVVQSFETARQKSSSSENCDRIYSGSEEDRGTAQTGFMAVLPEEEEEVVVGAKLPTTEKDDEVDMTEDQTNSMENFKVTNNESSSILRSFSDSSCYELHWFYLTPLGILPPLGCEPQPSL